MSTLVLKIIACVTMLIDHTAVTLWITGTLSGYYTLYRIMRGIGRIAFPIFCFQLVQGVKNTSDIKKYALRLLIFGIISEIPFDMALFAYKIVRTKEILYWGAQNVYFTLLLGLFCVYAIYRVSRLQGKAKFLGAVLTIALTLACMVIAEKVILSDYGWGGVAMIAVMGLLTAPFEKIRFRLASEQFFQMFVSAFAIASCVLLTNSTEIFALLALIPIYFYNGKQTVESRAARKGFYIFYPAHLAILAAIFILPYYFR